MLHSFKLYGQNYALDTESGAVHILSDIQRDILRYLRLPFESSFPASLRYDLAKYESEQLKDNYMQLRRYWLDGVFCSEQPFSLPSKADTLPNADVCVKFDEKKFIFASEVIKLADEGHTVISAKEDSNAPVKESEYDIVESEYERIAKEIIKRKCGRLPLPVFTFAPFELAFELDAKGYKHIVSEQAALAFGENGTPIQKKLVECAIAVHFA